MQRATTYFQQQIFNKIILLNLFCLIFGQLVKIERCNPKQQQNKNFLKNLPNNSYYLCNENGNLEKHYCPEGKFFNKNILECEDEEEKEKRINDKINFKQIKNEGNEDKNNTFKNIFFTKNNTDLNDSFDEENLLKEPQFQAPDDICSGAIPLTKLGAPVMCNPSISSCPDGFLCTLHQRTGTSYCCQSLIIDGGGQEGGGGGNIPPLCSGLQVTFFETSTGLPKTCSLTSPSNCPTGFGCNLVDGSFTRCCGRDFGCPTNSAGFVHPTTGSHVQCNSADPLSCPNGFICTQSSMFNTEFVVLTHQMPN
ncbi:hypothetical protein Mgra_00005836 [Meloidogyne graminicola]|uniref:Chitin-binding type-2 domain-containing protein n=1 Tax=Meloidogyne graminicola TaxID=189291 RepID=A0A8S9ZNK8_9BILA|nr:hypothetical protein Mgra_00005836 [Meloidogyne graminicola]